MFELLIQLSLAFIMFSIGLSVDFDDFKRVNKMPKSIVVGLLGQMLFLPLITFVLVLIVPMRMELQVGLILLSLCPGGTTSNYLTYVMKANSMLSTILTTINSGLILFTIPFVLTVVLPWYFGDAYSLKTDSDFPAGMIIEQLLLLVILPFGLGITVLKFFPKIINWMSFFKWATTILLLLVFTLMFFHQPEGQEPLKWVTSDFVVLLPVLMLMQVLFLFSGYLKARLFKLSLRDTITISIEMGLQNTSLAFLLVGLYYIGPEYRKVPMLYALFSFIFAFVGGYLIKRYHGRHFKKTL